MLDYNGHLFEEKVLGHCTVTFSGHMKWRDAKEFAKQNQPANKARIASLLERKVRFRLGKEVVFYTAVGTPFDYYHGVDGFFEFDGKVVTVDTTLNKEKRHAKADIIIRMSDVRDIDALADKIATTCRRRMS